MLNLKKKAQGLPLNTVVLAILVILVLVIIIVYFTTSMSKSGESIDQNTQGVSACDVGSYIIPAEKYIAAKPYSKEQDCSKLGDDWVRIYSANTGDENKPVCCAQRNP